MRVWLSCRIIILLAGVWGGLGFLASPGWSAPAFTLACTPHNDLFLTLKACGLKVKRHDSPSEAIQAARNDSAVLLLADAYPNHTLAVPDEVYRAARAKGLRLYIEYPDAVPGVKFGPPRTASWERCIISTDQLAPALPKGRLLMAHECHYLPTVEPGPWLVIGRVAGFDTAVFGIPETAQAVLFPLENGRVWVATTKLSDFVTGRFAPTAEWETLWSRLLTELAGEPVRLTWRPRVEASFTRDEHLPGSVQRTALARVAQWYFDSGLLVAPAMQPRLEKLWAQQAESAERPAGLKSGDGSLGVLEGFSSTILVDGSQRERVPVRDDCQAETAAVLAMDWAVRHHAASREAATNLLDFIYRRSDLCGGVRGDPKHPSYGLIAWGCTMPAWQVANYGDDNARGILGSVLAEACAGTSQWDDKVLRALLANLRTTGRAGFRGDRIDVPDLEHNGWAQYHDAAPVNYSPHFESYLWACYLWAYAHTGDRDFLDRTANAIGLTMVAFPAQWRWNDNMERARMLLCLAWLVRVDDTTEHRRWLNTVAEDLMSIQARCGALPERFRSAAASGYSIPHSNEAYGTSEGPLIQENGDPVSDQLYVTGFALLGWHEAAGATGDPRWRAAEDKLAEYACRIQTRSQSLPYLSGTWFRAFDFARWEAWASSGDAGWGAWSEEAGWGQAWTAVVLGLREKHTTFWDMTSGTRINQQMPAVQAAMAQNSGGPWR